MRRILMLILTLTVVLGAALTVPRAEATACGWRCQCSQLVCTCANPLHCGPRPAILCPQIACN